MNRCIHLLILLLGSLLAQGQQEYKLYEGLPNGSETWDWTEAISEENLFKTKVVYNITEPSVIAYIPPYYLATGTAVVIAPGGGHHVLSINSEGIELAKRLNSIGIAAFVLKYRLAHSETRDPVQEYLDKKGDKTDVFAVAPLAMADGLKAIEFVRKNAEKFDIKPNQIGMIGFSAGGSVALSVAYNADDSNKPDFLAPIYPSTVSVIGEKLPKEKTPIFLCVAADDQLDLMSPTIDVFQKWHQAGHPAELHVYEKGGHGFGMRTKKLPSDTWHERFEDWMHIHGYLKKLYPNKYERLFGQDAFAISRETSKEKLASNFAQLDRYRLANEAFADSGKSRPDVLFLGNSITEAWAKVDSAFFEENNFMGRGISGQTSAQLLLRFREDVLTLKPKVVLIHIGTNDVAENTGPFDAEFTLGNIQSMCELAHAHNIKVVLATILPSTKFEWNRKLGNRSEMIVDLNHKIRAFASDHSIPIVDYHTAMKNEENGMDKELAEDGVHPTKKGFERMKILALTVLEKVISDK